MLITLLSTQSTANNRTYHYVGGVFNSVNLPYIITSPATQNEDITYTNFITITLNYVNRKWEKKLKDSASSHWYLCLQAFKIITGTLANTAVIFIISHRLAKATFFF